MTIIAIDLESRKIATLPGTPLPPGHVAGPVLTSLLYPIEVTESLDAAATLRQAWFDDPIGNIDVAADIVSGTLTVLIAYKTLTADPEGIDVSGDIVEGELEVLIVFKSHTTDPENLDVAADIASGELEVVINYVTHTIPPEGLDVSADIVSGSLT